MEALPKLLSASKTSKQSLQIRKDSLVAQMIKNLPTMQETQVQSLGGEGPLGKGMATHSIVLALQYSCLETPLDRVARLAIVHGVVKSQRQLRN